MNKQKTIDKSRISLEVECQSGKHEAGRYKRAAEGISEWRLSSRSRNTRERRRKDEREKAGAKKLIARFDMHRHPSRPAWRARGHMATGGRGIAAVGDVGEPFAIKGERWDRRESEVGYREKGEDKQRTKHNIHMQG